MILSYIINLKQIESKNWELAFLGIKKIVDSYPLTLMRMKSETLLDEQRLCWTNEVYFKQNGETCIELRGDSTSLMYGSTFTFYKNIEAQINNKENVDYSQSPFYLPPTIQYFDCLPGYNGFDILNNYDTCGHPYTYCILAIGIYLEHCFYQQSYLHGDYNIPQIELVLTWLNDVFKTTIAMPKTINHNLLWQKISPHYNNVNHAIVRFWFLSKQALPEIIGFLLTQNKHAAEEFLAHDLKTYSSVNQQGAIKILIPYLEACQNLDTFILFFKKVQLVNTSSEFTLTALLKMIIDKGVCEKPFNNEMLNEINKERPILETGMQSLNKMFFSMCGLPNIIEFYTTPNELLEVFAYYEPQNGKIFKKILDTNVARATKKRKVTNDKIETAVDNIMDDAENDTTEHLDNLKPQGFTNEYYFIKEAETQKLCYNNFEQVAKVIGDSIRKNLANYETQLNKNLIDKTDKNKILKSIYNLVKNRGFVLTENAWANIDAEADMDILESINYFVSINNNEIKFCAIRKYYLEHSEYWGYLKE